MKVKELIELLKQFDEDKEVIFGYSVFPENGVNEAIEFGNDVELY